MIDDIIKEQQGTIVDVRTVEEFVTGHVYGSVNIPLQEIDIRLNELKNLKQPLILCCAAGIRSNNAQKYLEQFGIECYNGGSWSYINYLLSK